MPDPVRAMPWRGVNPHPAEPHLMHEWLVTNGLGGYASGTVSGAITRRYHGLLIAALPAPLGRTMMLNALSEQLRLPPERKVYRLGVEQQAVSGPPVHGAAALVEFSLEGGLPVWRYEAEGYTVEKRVFLLYRQNTVHIMYRLLSGEGVVRLGLRPAVHFRSHDAPVSSQLASPYRLSAIEDRYEISENPELPPLRLFMHGARAAFTVNRERQHVLYPIEESRGYESAGELWSPGFFRVDLAPGQEATLVASTESWETISALQPREALAAERARRALLIEQAHPKAQEGLGAELVLAADQFLIMPAGRVEDAARARAAGDEMRTVIAGYHWFTDWGRDTMISLEGLALATGRYNEAGWILRTFSHYIRDGLIPNVFPEGEKEGRYNTSDATLWFFHALHRYIEASNDRATLKLLLPKLLEIIEHHLRGTLFGIGVDPDDGLLRQGQEGSQLTWMDAKVGDWVVTPRRGKAVEINALWYNALCLAEKWVREEQGDGAARQFSEHAARARESFNRRFWYEDGGYLYDVVDGEHGDDSSCRPNQALAISLDSPVLDRARWPRVLEVVEQCLVTPLGLRTLAPGHPDYKAKYYGDLRSRDAAYHQGTVWPWLIGPFIDAWCKVHPEDRAGARRFIEAFGRHLGEACIGSISEIFDAEEPYIPRGCIAQAWSVAEALRSWVKTAE